MMAGEGEEVHHHNHNQGNNNNNNKAQPPAPYPANLPPYPEMIMEAIEALNEGNGSNKSSISRQIESTYGNMSPAHTTLLTHHLNMMRSAGQLQFLKNNYLKPDPNAPPRRGRGRPPKPKTPHVAAAAAISPSRPRGRPPKSRDDPPPPNNNKPTVSAAAATRLSGKKRGRPPKSASAPPPPATGGGGAPRGRGRPPKVKPPLPSVVA